MAETVQQRVAEIRERVRRVTTGPWQCMNGFEHPFSIESAEGFHVAHVAEYDEIYPEHAALIANAPSDLAFLLDALGAAQKDARRLDWLDRCSWIGLTKTDESDNNGVGLVNAAVMVQSSDPDGREDFKQQFAATFREAIDAAMSAHPATANATNSENSHPLPPQPSKP